MILTAEQLEMRRSRIGSSDVAAIVGVSPYRSHDAQSVWNAKCGFVDETGPDPDADQFWFGHEVEPIIAKRYEEKTGSRLLPGGTTVSADHPWACATVDRRVLGADRNVEIKFVGMNMLRGWDAASDTGIPHDKLVQVTWQMFVTGIRETDIAALIGGPSGFRVFRIPYDAALASDLLFHAEQFYRDHLLTREPPPITGSDSVREYLQAKHPRNDRELIEADDAAIQIMLERAAFARAEKSAATDKKKRDHLLMDRLGEHQGIVAIEHGLKFTWKTNKTGTRVPRFTSKDSDE